ncbi:uncharacterized protein LOC113346002 [Papaver somniferum]|uniref:uncharacterized protein LOC113346002 n=1 Tax=Papaver somniferum TaxID=3469 RepID=UPI000E6FE95A|nr:uncharacterized protein LOC113346002 [Papaver somniferum]
MAYSFRLDFTSTNNETEYEAVVHALRLAIEMKIEDARITSDSQIVIIHIEGTYSTNEPSLQKYKKLVLDLSVRIPRLSWRHIGRKDNRIADALAFIPSMLLDPVARDIKIKALLLPYIKKGEETQTDIMMIDDMEEEKENEDLDWRTEIHSYLEKGELPMKRLEAHKLKSRATNYELRDGILHRSGGRSLAYRTKIQIYYWSYMHEDAKQVSRICEECQRHGKKIHAPIFTKWAEVKAVQHIRDKDIFTFIFENIICIFGIPSQLLSDNGKQFDGENIEMLLNAFKIQSGKSTLLYRHNNGQVEATNKTITKNLKKKLEGNNKGWCEQVHNVVWAYKTTRREATGMSPFCLTYEVEAVLPTEIIIPTIKRESWEKT